MMISRKAISLYKMAGPTPGSERALEGALAGVFGLVAQFRLDLQQTVVLGDAVGTAQRTGLDLAGTSGHREIGNGRILGFAGAVRHDGGVIRAVRHLDGFEGFAERADLVDLDEDGVVDILCDALLQ